MSLKLLRHPSQVLNLVESCIDASRQTPTLTFLFNSVNWWPWPSHCFIIIETLGSLTSSFLLRIPWVGWSGVTANRQWGMGKLASSAQGTNVRWEGEPCLVLHLRDWEPWGVPRREASAPGHGGWRSGTRAWGCCQPLWGLFSYLPWKIFHPLCLLSVAGFK